MAARWTTVEELRDRHIREMGAELGAIYHVISNEVAGLHAKWEQYCRLFATSERRVKLLNETAGYFFRLIQDTFFEDVVLGLARLTDSIQIGRGKKAQENLTLQRLPSLIPDPRLRQDLEGLVEAALDACDAPRAWRNKRLAHRDLPVALATTGDPLPGISRADINVALGAFRTLLNQLEENYGAPVYYEHVLTNAGDADSLLYFLNRGRKGEQAMRARLRAGTPLPEDLIPEEEI